MTEAVKLLAGDARKDQLKAISYQRMGGKTRLTSMSRINESPKPDCVVCSDDSASIATVTVKSFEEIKLGDFVDRILPDCLMIKRDGELLVDFEGKILFERYDDMSDEDESAMYTKRLTKPLSQLALKPFSIIMLQADIEERTGVTIYVQLLEDSNLGQLDLICPGWKATYLKKGVVSNNADLASEETKEGHSVTAPIEKSVMEIEDDEVFMMTNDQAAQQKLDV